MNDYTAPVPCTHVGRQEEVVLHDDAKSLYRESYLRLGIALSRLLQSFG